MNDPVDARFFTAVQQVLRDCGAEGLEACRSAVDRAVTRGEPLDLRAARLELDSLAPDLRDRVLAQVHARMAGDLSAIWGLLPSAAGNRRPN